MNLMMAFLGEELAHEKNVTPAGNTKKAKTLRHNIRKGFKQRDTTTEYDRKVNNIGSKGFAFHQRGNKAIKDYQAFMSDHGIHKPRHAKATKGVTSTGINSTAPIPKKHFDVGREKEKQIKAQNNSRKVLPKRNNITNLYR